MAEARGMYAPGPPWKGGGAGGALPAGANVQVRTRFDGSWVGGFEIVGANGQGVRVRRRSDGYEIPRTFELDNVRSLD